MPKTCRAAVLTAFLASGLMAQEARQPLSDPQMVRAWHALRTVYCERCHGKDFEGLAAPSIVNYARTQSREAFVRMVLDGDPPRGMPGYRGNALVDQNIDGIYRYFVARADGSVDAASRPQRPAPEPEK
ncbi:MAG TPA: cytochrome c [Variovorax sp.]|nr:cytochrome c [Variovorax sp.]